MKGLVASFIASGAAILLWFHAATTLQVNLIHHLEFAEANSLSQDMFELSVVIKCVILILALIGLLNALIVLNRFKFWGILALLFSVIAISMIFVPPVSVTPVDVSPLFQE